jgi:hypothetical protein
MYSSVAKAGICTPGPNSAPFSPNPKLGGIITFLLPPAFIDLNTYSIPSHTPLLYGLDPITRANGFFSPPNVSTNTSPIAFYFSLEIDHNQVSWPWRSPPTNYHFRIPDPKFEHVVRKTRIIKYFKGQVMGNNDKTYIPYAIRQHHLLFLIDVSVEHKFGYWLHFKD